MSSRRGRNPYQFALGAIAIGSGALSIVLVFVEALIVRLTAVAAVVAGDVYSGSGSGSAVSLLATVSVLSLVGWLVTGALLWGPSARPTTAAPAATEPPDQD